MSRTSLVLLSFIGLAACATTMSRQDFSGTFAGNEAESVMLPGEVVPTDFRYVIHDDGVNLVIVQTFTARSGEPVRLQWAGVCDERARPVEGALFGAMSMSCRRSGRALINTIVGSGWSYMETCTLDSATRLTCAGAMPDAQGKAEPFSYALDRQ